MYKKTDSYDIIKYETGLIRVAKSSNQKLKIIYIYDYFMKYTDEDHRITVPDIISYLQNLGIKAERKSIYDDIEALRTYGADIIKTQGRSGGYYLASRTFELPELKLLVDSVQSSKFITHKKTDMLIRKLESLASVYEARQLQRQVYITNRVKRDNEAVYYNIDAIHRGIAQNRKISFRYFEYSVKKEKVFRKSGERYVVSPIALVWDDENYYLVAYDSDAGFVKHFRCDKISEPEVSDDKREDKEKYGNIDVASYGDKIFGMFSGSEKRVVLKFDNSLAGVVIDHFGREIPIIESGEGQFTVAVNVAVSPQFFGWLLGLGSKAQIIAPDDTVNQMRAYIEDICRMYD